MRSQTKIRILAGLLFMLMSFTCSAQGQTPALFYGEINANNINVRSDSTAGSRIICAVAKGQRVEVVKELYDWYKIKLPKTAPSFIRKDLLEAIDDKTARVIKDRVNIRLNASESSPILGKTGRNEVVHIIGAESGWYQIEPLDNSFGWVHKRFVSKVSEAQLEYELKARQELKQAAEKASLDALTVEGIIKPYGKVFRRIATHKLITGDNKVFLLKGSRESLESLTYRRVRITGKSTRPKGQKYDVIEVIKIEAID